MQQQPNRKRLILVILAAGLVVLLIVVSIIQAFSGKNNTAETGVIDDNYMLFSNSWYSVNYPVEYAVESEGSSVSITQNGENSTSLITVKRYGELSKLPKIDTFSETLLTNDGASVEKIGVNGDPSIKVTEDGEDKLITYYVFSSYYVWRITLVNVGDSDEIIKTFKPKDEDLDSIMAVSAARLGSA